MRTRWNVSVGSRSNRNLEVLVFKGRGKPEYPMKTLSEQGREPITISTHTWRRRQDLNPGHIGGRRVLSPLRHPCSPKMHTFRCRLRPSVHVNTLSVFSENESIWKRSCKWIKTKTHTYHVSVDGRKKTMTSNIAGTYVGSMPIEFNLRLKRAILSLSNVLVWTVENVSKQ